MYKFQQNVRFSFYDMNILKTISSRVKFSVQEYGYLMY